jgi:hypothetical protein
MRKHKKPTMDELLMLLHHSNDSQETLILYTTVKRWVRFQGASKLLDGREFQECTKSGRPVIHGPNYALFKHCNSSAALSFRHSIHLRSSNLALCQYDARDWNSAEASISARCVAVKSFLPLEFPVQTNTDRSF